MIIRHVFGASNTMSKKTAQNDRAFAAQSTVLMIGYGRQSSIFGSIDDPTRIAYLSYQRVLPLNLAWFQRLGIQLVLSPLLAIEFDAHDCARKLVDIGFEGQYRAVVDRLPNKTLIVSEFRAEFPDLDFQVTETNPKLFNQLNVGLNVNS